MPIVIKLLQLAAFCGQHNTCCKPLHRNKCSQPKAGSKNIVYKREAINHEMIKRYLQKRLQISFKNFLGYSCLRHKKINVKDPLLLRAYQKFKIKRKITYIKTVSDIKCE
jgi:hypothetical protein